MLILARKPGETILIGDDMRVTIQGVRSGSQIRISIEAPGDIKILREELTCRPLPDEAEGFDTGHRARKNRGTI